MSLCADLVTEHIQPLLSSSGISVVTLAFENLRCVPFKPQFVFEFELLFELFDIVRC